ASATTEPKPVSEPDEKVQDASPDASTGNEPYGVAQVVTPNGLEIYFQAGPKRLYRLRTTFWGHSPEGDDPEAPWIEVPSMSDVKDILDKAGLPWWGQGVGVRGTLTLAAEGLVDLAYVDPMTIDGMVDLIHGNKQKGIKGLLSQNKLTVNHTLDKAADRGTNVHKTLETWAETGTMPIPDVYPAHERGYVKGVVDFLLHSGAEPVAQEVMVGSLEWGFAGRFDLIAQIPDGAEVFVHRTEKGRGDRKEKIPGGRWLLDLKTSADVYESHMLQCAGYELAYRECYGEETDFQGVIQVPADGRYKLVKSRATIEHFQYLKFTYDSLKEIG
ncbi:MAG TPA: hypothetical protein VLA89_03210, partial [Gemmatimonadales bacterium]|nr:hypothetical protein [Gemmatimonadales bacterium]